MSKSRDGVFKIPKPKKHSKNLKCFCLPLITETPAVGVFNGFNVVISEWDSMHKIHQGGFFGKGNLSKGAPLHHYKKGDIPRIVFKNQFSKMLKWHNKAYYSCSDKYSSYSKSDYELSANSIDNLLKSSFVNDTQDYWKSWKRKPYDTSYPDSSRSNGILNPLKLLEFNPDIEDYFDFGFCEMVEKILLSKEGRKITVSQKNYEDVIVFTNDLDSPEFSLSDSDVRLDRLSYVGEENLNLTLEESFFLKFATNTLKIVDMNFTELDLTSLWKIFNSLDENFLIKYIIYHYYRAKGWIIKSGLKFGGQYLLYKHGPAYYHSTYLVQVLDKRKNMKWKDFIGMNRLVETYNKDLVLCNIQSNTSLDEESFPKGLRNYKVQEVLTRRWFPSKERFSSSTNEQ